MATKVPLNFYKRITKPLKRVPEIIYTAPVDRASTFISVIGSNTTNKLRTVTLSFSSGNIENVIVPDITLEPKEYNNFLPDKVVTTEGENVVAVADIEDLATINDQGLFWLYDLPVTITETSLQLEISSPTRVTVDWGAIDSRIRITNENFDDWETDIKQGNLEGVNTWSNLNEGPVNWGSGYSSSVLLSSTGNWAVLRQNSTSIEKQYFNTTNYLRLSVQNLNFGPTPWWQLLTPPAYWGLLAIQSGNPVDESGININGLLGQKVALTFWARASQPTKIFSESQIHGTPYFSTPILWKMFELTPDWQQFTHTYTLPTITEVTRAAFLTNQINTTNPDAPIYVPLTSTIAMPPVSAWFTQVDIKINATRRGWINMGAAETRLPYIGEPMPLSTLSAITDSALTNGFYDIAAVRFTLGDGTNNFTTELSSGSQSTSFVYDPTLDTDTNLTLSILESVNTQ